MYGSIIGDIAGSYIEVLEILTKRTFKDRIKILDKGIDLINYMCSCTDDSILTVAIADAILNNKNYENKLKEYGLLELQKGLDIYGRGKFSPGFIKWLNGNYQGNSYGNGCVMRISPIGFLFEDLETVKNESFKATTVSHNHKDSIKASEAVATSIFYLRNGKNKGWLETYIKDNYYELNFDLDDLRKNYKFTSKAINSVPQAIYCFLVSNNFEDAIRIALSIGGDSDTIACITGSLAESYYGLDEKLIDSVKPYIKDYMVPIINQFYNKQKILNKKRF